MKPIFKRSDRVPTSYSFEKPNETRSSLWSSVQNGATSPLVLRWMCDSPWTECAWRTTPLYVAQTSYNRVIVDLTFRITTCRFLLAIVSRSWDLVCINLSYASREFVCARSTVFVHDLDSNFGFVHRRGHHAFRESSCVSLAHGPHWLFLLWRHCEAISAAANQKPFVNKDLCTRKSVKRTVKVVRAKRLASAWQLKMSGSFSRELDQYSYND